MDEEVQRIVVTSGNRGQIHTIYSLVSRHQPPEFCGGVGIGSIPIKNWFEAIRLLEMANHERV